MTAARLDSHPIVSTTNADQAQSVVSRDLADSRIHRVVDSNKFRFDMNGVHFGDTLVAWNYYRAATDLQNGQVEDTIGFILGEQCPVFRMNQEAVACTASTAAIVSRSRMSVDRPAGSSILVLRTNYQALERRYSEVTGTTPKGRIQFARSVDLTTGPGAIAKQTLLHIVSQLEAESTISSNNLLRSGIDDLLMTTLLSLPHSHSERLHRDVGDVAPAVLRRAEEYIATHCLEPIKMSDVMQACGCSSSMLHRAFKKHRGYTPGDFLKSRRIERARHRLLSPTLQDTVTSIALECGFSHMSRFAEIYRRRFGESPSETLRRSR